MLIGMGGGAASSMNTGANIADLDFDSVQRGNAEIQRRAQEVIDRCWALGEANPILSIHDVGAGGLSNALPELVHGAGRGGQFDLREIPSEEPGMTPVQIWCNEAQERYVLAIAPERFDAFEAMCERERCPFAVVGTATDDGWLRSRIRCSATTRSTWNSRSLLGKPPKMTRDVKQRARTAASARSLRRSGCEEAALRVLRFPAVANKTFPDLDRRPHGGRPVRARSVRRPLAGAGGRCRGHADGIRDLSRRSVRDGRAHAARRDRWRRHPGRMAVGEALTNIAAARIANIGDVKLSANWMAAAGYPGEDAALFDTVERWRWNCARSSASASRSARIRCR